MERQCPEIQGVYFSISDNCLKFLPITLKYRGFISAEAIIA